MAIVLTGPQPSIKNILYATDFSEQARAALPYAISIARQFHSALHLVHVVTPVTNVTPYGPSDFDTRGPAEEQMAKLLRSADLGDITHDANVEEGNLWTVLRELFSSKDFDLIVLGTHGRGGFQQLLLGSVAEQIIRSAPCPVLTIGPNVVAVPAYRTRSILCALDLPPDPGRALVYSMALAEESGARLTLVHAVPDPDKGGGCTNAVKWDIQRHMADLLPTSHKLCPDPKVAVDFGPVPQVIAWIAQKENADLIVMGVKHTGHPWLSSHLGSVTVHQVLLRASCPVLTIRD